MLKSYDFSVEVKETSHLVGTLRAHVRVIRHSTDGPLIVMEMEDFTRFPLSADSNRKTVAASRSTTQAGLKILAYRMEMLAFALRKAAEELPYTPEEAERKGSREPQPTHQA